MTLACKRVKAQNKEQRKSLTKHFICDTIKSQGKEDKMTNRKINNIGSRRTAQRYCATCNTDTALDTGRAHMVLHGSRMLTPIEFNDLLKVKGIDRKLVHKAFKNYYGQEFKGWTYEYSL